MLLIALAVLVVITDRIAWASVSQWREDQATNIWLGYTRNLFQIPVGLVSSIGIPNPNGLVLLSVLLSRLPNIWMISTFLGLLQAAMLGWVCWSMTHDSRMLLVIIGPALSSITLRGASVELFSQWMLIPANLLFCAGILIYIRYPTPWMVTTSVAAALFSPAIYLAGAVNSIVYGLIMLIVLVLRPPRFAWRAWLAPLTASGVIILGSVWLTWLPYFHQVGYAAILHSGSYGHLTSLAKLLAAMKSIALFPIWSLSQYASRQLFPILEVEPRILSSWAWSGYQLMLSLSFAQGLICYVSLLIGAGALLLKRRSLANLVTPQRRTTALGVLLMALFVILCYAVAPMVGGPVWAGGQRLDQVTQFLPFLLIVWYLTPLLVEQPQPAQKFLRSLTWVNAASFTIVSLMAGWLIIVNNLNYRGNVLSDADVPVVDKLEVTGFIAKDWAAHSSSSQIPVDYDLGGGRWDWVTRFGKAYLKWYPAPYTMGRVFDFQLLRSYGLHNSQEGMQARSFGTGRYLVTYAFEPPPAITGASRRDFEFGRLRVTIVER